ncbi:MAG TPA: TIM barrel protein [Mariniphaga sp.]|nr:TIM barrel protein [Mariniphaga sp.]
MKSKFTRRNFLGTAAASTAAMVLPGCNPATGNKNENSSFEINKNPLKLGLMTYMIGASWDIDTIIKNLHETKLEHVELRTTHKHGVEVDLNKQQREEIKKRFADANIATSLASAFSYHYDDQEELKKSIEGTKAFLQLAADIGAQGIRVFPNAVPEEGNPDREKVLQQIAKSVSECATVGHNLGVELRLEEHGKGTANIPVIKQILDYADNPHVYVIWNCADSDYTGEGLPQGYEGMGLEAQFDMVKDRIRCVHLRELSTSYPWRRLFSLLSNAGYQGYLDIEVSPASCEPVRYLNNYRALFLALQNAI